MTYHRRGNETMKKINLVLLGLLLTLNGGPVQEIVDSCAKSAEVCENLAEHASWQRKALFGMLDPNYLADVLAEIEEAKDDGNIQAYFVFRE